MKTRSSTRKVSSEVVSVHRPMIYRKPPLWLHTLLTEKFFNVCITHEEFQKNDTNFYCVTCWTPLCYHCLPHHKSHSILQIRRYMYSYVIRLEAASQLMDCSSIQPYKNNGAKVVFLNQRPRAQPQLKQHNRDTSKFCRTCHNTVQEPSLYCSISCKIEHVLETKGDLSKFLQSCKALALSGDALMTPDTVLEAVSSNQTFSDSAGSSSETVFCTAFSAINFTVRKRRTRVPSRGLHAQVVTAPSRPCRAPWRKQVVPRRAPMV